MCGITGFAGSPDPAARTHLEQMTGVIRHRGPDDSGFFFDAGVALGHRRLSIIDLSGGHQPMSNEDGSRWIVYNGEIFNHAALRPELEAAGHRYATRCDTEMVLHAWEQYGAACVTRFRGMFAFAAWDRASRCLFCARDRLGIKPFYYYWDGRLFAFGSEIKALLEHPAISAALDESVLPEYLSFGYTAGDRTLFRRIHKLMPGHHLTLSMGQDQPALRIERYWDIPPGTPDEEGRDDASWIAECRSRLEETVRMRLMSDVPLGVFLSGGVDSSAIAALMTRMVSGRVKTFSVGYREEAYSELAYARQVAGLLGTEHSEVTVGMDDFFDVLPSLIWHEDEPVVWPSSVPLYFVSKLAAGQVKVVLTGEGSDELFAGYSRYSLYLSNLRWLAAYRTVPAPLRNAMREWVAVTRLLPGALRRKVQHTIIGAGESLEALYLDNFYSAFGAAGMKKLMGAARRGGAYDGYLERFQGAPGASILSRLLYADQKTYLVELLMKQDQMSMASSIESRVPFLDHPFVEFAARVPERLKIRGGTGKYILKEAVADLLPREIVHRRKMGFPTPLRQWLASRRAEPLFASLLSREGVIASCLDLHAVRELLDAHRRGSHDATDRIWRLLNLQLWGDVFLAGNKPVVKNIGASGSA